MAEVKVLENVEQEATAPAMEETAADSAAPAETRVNLKARWQAIPRKKRRRIIRLCILALLLVIAAVVLLKVLGGKSSDRERWSPTLCSTVPSPPRSRAAA